MIEALAPILASGIVRRDNLCDDAVAFPAAERLWDETDLFGDPGTPLTEPAHELDDEGAEAFSAGQGDAPSAVPSQPQSAAEAIAKLLGPSPVGVDDLVRASGFTVSQVNAALFDLELDGSLVRHGGGLVALKPG